MGYMNYEMGEWLQQIDQLPSTVEQFDIAGGATRPWVRNLPLRYQGVLLTAIRGCDTVRKEDPSKVITRMIRRAVLNPADPRESTVKGGFFGFSRDALRRDIPEFLHDLDAYPMHYLMHLTHACEVIGYSNNLTAAVETYHTLPGVYGRFFSCLYHDICHTLHMRPESALDLRQRLTMDRVAAGIVERNFTTTK